MSQRTMSMPVVWWDDGKIDAAVTRQFVCRQLLSEEIARLDRPLDFGDGLTDGTYWSWINEKAKRIFLILVDLGIPDQIFGVVDDSWDDSDLPIALDQVERLALTAARDEKFDRKFYHRQFHYLLRHVEHGEHVVYQDPEVVPMDVVDRRASRGNSIDKVSLPNAPGEVLCRRRIPLGHGPGCLPMDEFMHEINSIKHIQNEHLVSYWGSYIYQGYGWVLFTPASDYTLNTLLTATPAPIKAMDKHRRRRLVMNWIHCLIDSLSYLHSRGISHNGNIKPSTILLNNDHHIFFSDFTRLNAELLLTAAESKGFDKESYDYAAPERWFKPSGGYSGGSASIFAGGGGRRPTMVSPSTSPQDQYTLSGISRSDSQGSGTATTAGVFNAPNPQLNPQAADIFSLGCVILELISWVMKKQRSSFSTHRSAKHKTAGRGGAVLDSSFHKNTGQVDSWIKILNKEATKKDDPVIKGGVPPLLALVVEMLSLAPENRPSAPRVVERMYKILTEVCGISEPHCVHRYGGWDFGLGRLHVSERLDTAAPTPSISRRPSSAAARRTSVEHRRQSSGGTGNGGQGGVGLANGGPVQSLGAIMSPTWRAREKVRALRQSPPPPQMMYGAAYRDPLTC